MSATNHDAELRRLLAELPSLRLRPEDWSEIERILTDIGAGERHRVEELSQVVFEARVRRRFHGTRAGADVVPTKQTSVLPWVGLVCAALLIAVGGLLGGGVILVGVVALAAFVFGIAFAGSRVAHRGGSGRPGEPEDAPEPIPDAVALRLDALRQP